MLSDATVFAMKNNRPDHWNWGVRWPRICNCIRFRLGRAAAVDLHIWISPTENTFQAAWIESGRTGPPTPATNHNWHALRKQTGSGYPSISSSRQRAAHTICFPSACVPTAAAAAVKLEAVKPRNIRCTGKRQDLRHPWGYMAHVLGLCMFSPVRRSIF